VKRPVIHLLALCAIVAGGLVATAAPAATKVPCWVKLINDWYDGSIDGTYPIPCYQQAIDHLPADIQAYSSAAQDIQRALQKRIAQGTNPTPPSSTGKGSGGPGRHDGGPLPGSGSPSSVPIPLLVLGGIAAVLLVAGGIGFAARRMQARRLPIRPGQSTPQQ
jgi:hypothetical protein